MPPPSTDKSSQATEAQAMPSPKTSQSPPKHTGTTDLLSTPPKSPSVEIIHTVVEGEKIQASSEGEQKSKTPKDKGKKTLTAEQLAEEEKKSKELAKYGTRPADAQSLKLKPPSQQSLESNLGLTPQEIEEARLAQKALDDSKALSVKVAKEEAIKAKSADPIFTQKSVLSAIEEERNEEISWYKKTMHHRLNRSPISNVKIATSRTNSKDIRLIIDREDGSMKSVRDIHLEHFGLPEWYEISQHLLRSVNPKKDIFVKCIDGLMEKMKEIKRKHNIVLSTDERAKLQSMKEEIRLPKVKNPTDKVFKEMATEGKIPNVSNLNLSIPTSVPYPTTTLSLSPIPGLFFNDGFGRRVFFRFAQIPIADTLFLEGISNLFPYIPEAQPFYRNVLDEIKRRQTSKK